MQNCTTAYPYSITNFSVLVGWKLLNVSICRSSGNIAIKAHNYLGKNQERISIRFI